MAVKVTTCPSGHSKQIFVCLTGTCDGELGNSGSLFFFNICELQTG